MLALEPDEKQAVILSALVLHQLRAELELVDAKAPAIAAIKRHVPDLLLLTSEISPDDERDITAFVRTLDAADHLKTLTIPKLHFDEEGAPSGGFLHAFKGRRVVSRPQGCEPRVFARQVQRWLTRAEELKAERAAWQRPSETSLKVPGTPEVRAGTQHASTSPAPAGKPIARDYPLPPVRQRVAALDARPSPFGSSRTRLDLPADVPDGWSDDLARLMTSLKLPIPVAAFAYPRGCRIQQVRLGRPRPGPASPRAFHDAGAWRPPARA